MAVLKCVYFFFVFLIIETITVIKISLRSNLVPVMYADFLKKTKVFYGRNVIIASNTQIVFLKY